MYSILITNKSYEAMSCYVGRELQASNLSNPEDKVTEYVK